MTEKLKYLQLSELNSDNLFIEKNSNLIIDDQESLDNYSWQQISNLLIPSLLVVSGTDLSSRLASNIRNSDLNPWIIAYPAKGGLEVKKRLSIFRDVPQYDIESIRSGPQGFPSILLPKELKKKLEQKFDKTNEPNILIVDDVIGSGQTLKAIAETMGSIVQNANAVPIPDSEYYSRFRDNCRSYGLPTYSAATWLIYKSTNIMTSWGNRIISPIIYALEYQGQSGKAAVNSISTLLRQGDKEDKVRSAYAQKYSNNPANFINLLKDLGRN